MGKPFFFPGGPILAGCSASVQLSAFQRTVYLDRPCSGSDQLKVLLPVEYGRPDGADWHESESETNFAVVCDLFRKCRRKKPVMGFNGSSCLQRLSGSWMD